VKCGIRTRPVAAVLLALLAPAGCGDPVGPGGPGAATVSVRPVLPEWAGLGLFNLAVDRARILVVRPPAEAALDTLVFFPTDSSQISVRLRVPLIAPREALTVSIQLLAGETLLFSGSRSVEVSEAASVAPPIPMQYVGPGREMTTLRISPRDSVLLPGATFTFLIEAAAGTTPLNAFYVAWSTSDPQTAPVDPKGTLRAPDTRGSVFLHAVSPTGIRDSTRVSFAPPPSTMLLSGGDGQIGTVGALLPDPLQVQVLAPDGLGVPGVRVRFQALSGGSVTDSVAITDDQGVARTTVRLGPTAGVQVFEATSPLLPPINFTANAQPGPPALITALAGSDQVDTVGRLLPQAFVARVTDAFGNARPGVPVTWTVVVGNGALSNASAVTNLSGIAFAEYTLGPVPTLHVIRVNITGLLASADFRATSVPGPPHTIAAFAGQGQTDTVASTLAPLVVVVRDEFDNLLPGVVIDWTAEPGGGELSAPATSTDVFGRSQVTYRLPSAAGPVTVTALVRDTELDVAFGVTGTHGAPVVLAITAGNGQTGDPGEELEPFRVRVTDQFGNPAPEVTVTWEIEEGDGLLSTEESVSGADGQAEAVYTLGPTPGVQRIRARLDSGAEVVFSVTTGDS
jgi:hypothetical protein